MPSLAKPRIASSPLLRKYMLPMMTTPPITSKVGNSVGLVLPKQALAHLKVGEGDTVCLTDAAEGSVRMTANPEVSRQMEVVQDVMHRYRNTLRELAK